MVLVTKGHRLHARNSDFGDVGGAIDPAENTASTITQKGEPPKMLT